MFPEHLLCAGGLGIHQQTKQQKSSSSRGVVGNVTLGSKTTTCKGARSLGGTGKNREIKEPRQGLAALKGCRTEQESKRKEGTTPQFGGESSRQRHSRQRPGAGFQIQQGGREAGAEQREEAD